MTRGKLQRFVGLAGEDDEQAIVREISGKIGRPCHFHILAIVQNGLEIFEFGNGAIDDMAKVDQLLFVELEIAILVEFHEDGGGKNVIKAPDMGKLLHRAVGRYGEFQPRLGKDMRVGKCNRGQTARQQCDCCRPDETALEQG